MKVAINIAIPMQLDFANDLGSILPPRKNIPSDLSLFSRQTTCSEEWLEASDSEVHSLP